MCMWRRSGYKVSVWEGRRGKWGGEGGGGEGGEGGGGEGGARGKFHKSQQTFKEKVILIVLIGHLDSAGRREETAMFNRQTYNYTTCMYMNNQ